MSADAAADKHTRFSCGDRLMTTTRQFWLSRRDLQIITPQHEKTDLVMSSQRQNHYNDSETPHERLLTSSGELPAAVVEGVQILHHLRTMTHHFTSHAN